MSSSDPWQNKLATQALADLRAWSQLPYPEYLAKYQQAFGTNIDRFKGLGISANDADAHRAKNSPLFPTATTAYNRNVYNAPYFDLNDAMLQRLRETSNITKGSLKTPGFGPDTNTAEDYYNYLRNMTPAQQGEFDRVTALIDSRSDDYSSSLSMAMQPWGAIPVATALLGVLGTAGAGPLGRFLGPSGTTGVLPTGGVISTGAYPGGMIGSSAAGGSAALAAAGGSNILKSLSNLSGWGKLKLAGTVLNAGSMLYKGGSYPTLPPMPALTPGRTNMAAIPMSNPEKLKRGRMATMLTSNIDSGGLGVINRPSASATLLGG